MRGIERSFTVTSLNWKTPFMAFGITAAIDPAFCVTFATRAVRGRFAR
jgi:hypothetical protein